MKIAVKKPHDRGERLGGIRSRDLDHQPRPLLGGKRQHLEDALAVDPLRLGNQFDPRLPLPRLAREHVGRPGMEPLLQSHHDIPGDRLLHRMPPLLSGNHAMVVGRLQQMLDVGRRLRRLQFPAERIVA